MLHSDEEDKPSPKSDPMLDHHPDRDTQYLSQHPKIHSRKTEQTIFFIIYLLPSINHEEQYGNSFRDRGSDSGTRYPQSGEPELTEYQDIVQDHVGKHHHHRIGRQDLRIRRTHVKRTEHHRYKREEEPVHPPVQIAHRRPIHLF